jgi:hypothetical protein
MYDISTLVKLNDLAVGYSYLLRRPKRKKNSWNHQFFVHTCFTISKVLKAQRPYRLKSQNSSTGRSNNGKITFWARIGNLYEVLFVR